MTTTVRTSVRGREQERSDNGVGESGDTTWFVPLGPRDLKSRMIQFTAKEGNHGLPTNTTGSAELPASSAAEHTRISRNGLSFFLPADPLGLAGCPVQTSAKYSLGRSRAVRQKPRPCLSKESVLSRLEEKLVQTMQKEERRQKELSGTNQRTAQRSSYTQHRRSVVESKAASLGRSAAQRSRGPETPSQRGLQSALQRKPRLSQQERMERLARNHELLQSTADALKRKLRRKARSESKAATDKQAPSAAAEHLDRPTAAQVTPLRIAHAETGASRSASPPDFLFTAPKRPSVLQRLADQFGFQMQDSPRCLRADEDEEELLFADDNQGPLDSKSILAESAVDFDHPLDQDSGTEQLAVGGEGLENTAEFDEEPPRLDEEPLEEAKPLDLVPDQNMRLRKEFFGVSASEQAHEREQFQQRDQSNESPGIAQEY